MKIYRPLGVTVIAIFFIITAVLGLTAGVMFEIYYVANYINSIYTNLFFSLNLVYYIPEYGIYYLFMGLSVAINDMSSVIYYHLAVVAVLVGAFVHLIASSGLLYMKKWGYYLTIIIRILNIIALGIVGIVLGIIILVYLLGDVKYEFE
ncbi:MAG: hypothetical protein ACUVXA_13530 [Candidatus Jordarchaeum sp.]|uniref:hypothetical protein n=1 Tax=Candidatus Jordarchaeum sp. TaxID=2823881 RepID=UPI00404A2FFD